jgi:hypothetical protein
MMTSDDRSITQRFIDYVRDLSHEGAIADPQADRLEEFR